jgi:hypothetical protein
MLWRFFGEAINHDNAEAIVAMMSSVMRETRGQLGEYTSSEREKGLFAFLFWRRLGCHAATDYAAQWAGLAIMRFCQTSTVIKH